MNLKEIKRNCMNCRTVENILLYNINNMAYLNNVEFKNSSIFDFTSFNNKVYFFNNQKLYEVFDTGKLIEIFYIKDAQNIQIVSKNIFEFFKRISRKELEYIFYDFQYNELWKTIGDEWVDVLSEKFIMLRGRLDVNIKSFTVKNINNGFQTWSFSLPEGFSIHMKPQVVNSVIFFNSFKEVNRYNKVVGLNLDSGKLLWELNYQIPYEKQLIAFLLNPSDNLCYGYGGGVYQIFNPVKGEMVFEKNMEKLYKTGIDPEVNRNVIYDDKLWFVSGRGKKVKFGAVNLADGELVFVQDYPLEFDEQFDTPVFHNGKLYLRGLHYKTLYVFE